jgi:streptomycin 6-kinase
MRHFERRLETISAAAALDTRRPLGRILACCGLSAVWSLEAGESAVTALVIAELAAAKLQQSR